MDSIFGFLPNEIKDWLDASIAKDSLCVYSHYDSPPLFFFSLLKYGNRQIMGVLAVLERFLGDADERGNAYLLHLLDKQHTRLKSLFERHVVSCHSADAV
jgi:exocyst complex component 1